MKQLGLGIIVATGLMFPAFGQGVDPLIGSWKLTGTAAFRSLTLTWTGEGQTLIDTAEGVTTQGQPFKAVYRHIYDVVLHPTTGSQNYDSIGYTRVGNTKGEPLASSAPWPARGGATSWEIPHCAARDRGHPT
jgi:hypothetical protein